jgi:hypothetical protein
MFLVPDRLSGGREIGMIAEYGMQTICPLA